MKLRTRVALLSAVVATAPAALAAQITQDLARALAVKCPVKADLPKDLPLAVAVNAIGGVRVLPQRVTEGDSLIVFVSHDRGLTSSLVVKRTSAFRSADASRTFGAPGVEMTAPPPAGDQCVVSQFVIRNFSAPKADISVSEMTDKGETALGAFEMPVAAIYSGVISVGVMSTSLRDEVYALYRERGSALPAGDSVITRVSRGSRRQVWAVSYSPFFQPDRDIRAPYGSARNKFLRHINPTVAIAPAAPANNVFFGVTMDLYPFPMAITAGRHFGRRSRLDPDYDLAPGDTVSGARGGLPMIQQWRSADFIGVMFDAQSMLQMLKVAADGLLGKTGS